MIDEDNNKDDVGPDLNGTFTAAKVKDISSITLIRSILIVSSNKLLYHKPLRLCSITTSLSVRAIFF
tara:strand:+ start:49183 stop:49383 length:201 start_codon:yes stop_codon:yes gene_type:complete